MLKVELRRAKDNYKRERDRILEVKGAVIHKANIELFEKRIRVFFEKEKKLRKHDQGIIRRAQLLCAQRTRSRLAKLARHPGVHELTYCATLKNAVDRDMATAEMLITAGNVAKARELRKRATDKITQLNALQKKCVAILTKNPFPMLSPSPQLPEDGGID